MPDATLNDREFVEWFAKPTSDRSMGDWWRMEVLADTSGSLNEALCRHATLRLDLADANKRIAELELENAALDEGGAIALRERDEARETLEKVREAAKLLCDRLGEIEKPINDIICLQFARTGRGYEGPTWGKPLKALLALLPAPPAQPPCPKCRGLKGRKMALSEIPGSVLNDGCNGEGWEPCPECGGSGVAPEKKP